MPNSENHNLFQRVDEIYTALAQDEIEKAIKELLGVVNDFSQDRQHLRMAIELSNDYYSLSNQGSSNPQEVVKEQKTIIQRIFDLINALEQGSVAANS